MNNQLSAGARRFNANAQPMSWGPWVTLASPLGSITYKISYSAVGETLVMGRVSYPKTEGRVTEEFRDETTITTGDNVAGTVEVSFKGIPTGSPVDVLVSP